MIGRRTNPFVYSGKTLLSISDWDKKVDEEIARVKKLKKGGHWIVQPAGAKESLYLDDNTIALKGCGKVTAKKLEEIGVSNIGELIKTTSDSPDKLFQHCSVKLIDSFVQQCKEIIQEHRPKADDLREKKIRMKRNTVPNGHP